MPLYFYLYFGIDVVIATFCIFVLYRHFNYGLCMDILLLFHRYGIILYRYIDEHDLWAGIFGIYVYVMAFVYGFMIVWIHMWTNVFDVGCDVYDMSND